VTEVAPPLTADQIGVQAVRFPSGVPMPTITDASVDPYIRTRVSTTPMVEALIFFPQTSLRYPGIVLLHEWWGLTSQIKDVGARLAREGFTVLVPNLYGRQGGMVTANAEVAAALMQQIKADAIMQDLTSCCEFLNTQDHVQRAVHAVVGFSMGGSLAIQFACHRRRLRAAVSFYGRLMVPAATLKDLACPLLYIQGGEDRDVPAQEVEQLRLGAGEFGKQVEIVTYPDAAHGFFNETTKGSYNEPAATAAWTRTVNFLTQTLK
jgi:carboxymethylenebutenolidase